MLERIIYTRPDGGVDVFSPADNCMAAMTCGGGYWGDVEATDRGFLDRQIAAHAEHGIGERFARSWVIGLQFGGLTQAEAFAVFRDRWCAHLGTAFEIVESPLLDRNYWFRNAWRRSHNGGPIGIEVKAARRIQHNRIVEAAKRARAELQMPRWRERLRRASTHEEVRTIWPPGLPR